MTSPGPIQPSRQSELGIVQIDVRPASGTKSGFWRSAIEWLKGLWPQERVVSSEVQSAARAGLDGGKAWLRQMAVQNADYEAAAIQKLSDARRTSVLTPAEEDKIRAEARLIDEQAKTEAQNRKLALMKALEAEGVAVYPIIDDKTGELALYFTDNRVPR